MKSDGPAFEVGIGIATLGIIIHGVGALLLFVVPVQFPTTWNYLAPWFDPIATAESLLTTFGVPVIAAIGAFLVVWRYDTGMKAIIVGFGVGGFVFGTGVLLVDLLVTAPDLRASGVRYAVSVLERTVFFLLLAIGAGKVAEETGYVRATSCC